jgi:hypothetical protein
VRELVFRHCHRHRFTHSSWDPEIEEGHIRDLVGTVQGLPNVTRLDIREADLLVMQQLFMRRAVPAVWSIIAPRLRVLHIETFPSEESRTSISQDASLLANVEELKLSVQTTSYGFSDSHSGSAYTPVDLATFICGPSLSLTTLHIALPEQASLPGTGYNALFQALSLREFPQLCDLQLSLALIPGHSYAGIAAWLTVRAPRLQHFSLLSQECWKATFSAKDYFGLLEQVVPEMTQLQHLGISYPHGSAYYTPKPTEAALAISGLLQTLQRAIELGIRVVSISGRAFDLDDLHLALHIDQQPNGEAEIPLMEQCCSDDQLLDVLATRFSHLPVDSDCLQSADAVSGLWVLVLRSYGSCFVIQACHRCAQQGPATWSLQSLSLKRSYYAKDAPLKGLDAIATYTVQ